ncbi:MAG TPA: acyl-CoA reductase [Caulobacteraceae bacterium]|jgi:hypothetical protein|nr:acyl-CoA reductase [Caulobacteraceae bacterium]
MTAAVWFSHPAGALDSCSLDHLLSRIESARRTVAPAFSLQRLELVAGVSAEILRGKGDASPGVTHFAYWTRRQALKAFAADHRARLPADSLARPRGMVFHLPPQNVETVFLYSWVISYLCGNANLVRLPTELSEPMARLLDLFQVAVRNAGDAGQMFVRYPVSETTNAALSQASDARIVWGGDEKVRAFSTLPLRKGGKAIWFGDRRSAAVANGDALRGLDHSARRELAARLHNDIFVFDQMACSSPVRLYVTGSEDSCGAAVDALLAEVSHIASARGSGPATGHAIRKMVASMALAGQGAATRVVRYSNSLTSVVAREVEDRPPVGGGFLELVYVDDLLAVAETLAENTQTLVHFGFDKETLWRFAADLPPFCVSRIVAMGQALNFDSIWDGYDLASELTELTRVG